MTNNLLLEPNLLTIEERWDAVATFYNNLIDQGEFSERELTGLTEFLYERLFSLNPQRVLDIGCGSGLLASWIVKNIKTVSAIIGLDISTKMLDIAKKNTQLMKVSYIKSCAEQLGAAIAEKDGFSANPIFSQLSDNRSFELVIAHLSLMDMYDLSAVIRGVSRYISPGGTFIATITNPFCGFLKTEQYYETPLKSETKHIQYSSEFWKQGNFCFQNSDGSLPFVFVKHRPLSCYIQELEKNGFRLTRFADHFLYPGQFESIYLYLEAEF